jgi:phosphoribosylamine---glycine ligase
VGAAILVVGAGSREHALAWAMGSDALVAPGNAGMAGVRRAPLPLDPSGLPDARDVLEIVEREGVGLVVVGPEAPLVAGMTDALRAAGVPVFGPSRAAAELEGSKAWCREVATAAGVAMAPGAAFDDPAEAAGFARRLGGRVAVKADGLASGKGVTVCSSPGEAEAAIRAAMLERAFGAAGERLVVERAIAGPELSVICICDASTCLALPAARDHKRLLDDDRGPNTGGMGAVSPPEDVPEALVAEIVRGVHVPVLAELARRGRPFRGALFAGLMLTAEGPVLLEFNVRLGDPETQAVLPRLAVALRPLLEAAATDRLAEAAATLGIESALLPVRDLATVAVVLASPGYPESPRSGDRLPDLAAATDEGCLVFTAGVLEDPVGVLRSAGGRILTVVGRGPDLAAAAANAYRGAERLTFAGAQLRRDIGTPAARAPRPAEAWA